MQDQTYQSFQYLAWGILVGYFGLSAWDWVKTWKQEKSSAKPAQKNTQKEQQAQANV